MASLGPLDKWASKNFTDAVATQSIYDDSSASRIPASRVWQLPSAATTYICSGGIISYESRRAKRDQQK